MIPVFVQTVNTNVTNLLKTTKKSLQNRNKNAKIVGFKQYAQRQDIEIVQKLHRVSIAYRQN